jgi:hypothetical protein
VANRAEGLSLTSVSALGNGNRLGAGFLCPDRRPCSGGAHRGKRGPMHSPRDAHRDGMVHTQAARSEERQHLRFPQRDHYLFTPQRVSVSVPFPVSPRVRSFRLCSPRGRTRSERAKRREHPVSLVAHPVGSVISEEDNGRSQSAQAGRSPVPYHSIVGGQLVRGRLREYLQ